MLIRLDMVTQIKSLYYSSFSNCGNHYFHSCQITGKPVQLQTLARIFKQPLKCRNEAGPLL